MEQIEETVSRIAELIVKDIMSDPPLSADEQAELDAWADAKEGRRQVIADTNSIHWVANQLHKAYDEKHAFWKQLQARTATHPGVEPLPDLIYEPDGWLPGKRLRYRRKPFWQRLLFWRRN